MKRPMVAFLTQLLLAIQLIEDWLAERDEFELPVPICEQSDDSIGLGFTTSKRSAKLYRPAAHF
jgi:hypothetical protein